MHSCASRMREYGGNENTHRNHCGYIRFVYTRVSSSSPFSFSLSISLSCVSQRIGTRACSLRPGTRTSNRRINNPSFTCCLCPKPSCSFQWSWKLCGREDGIHQGWRVKGSFLYVCFNVERGKVLRRVGNIHRELMMMMIFEVEIGDLLSIW